MPSIRSWWSDARSAIDAKQGARCRIRREYAGCSLTVANSSSVELARLVEDPVGDRELADVVQQPGAAQVALHDRVEAEDLADPHGDLRHPHGVQGGERRLRVDHPRERLGDAVDPVVVGAQHQVAGLPVRHVGVLERRPERAVAADGQEGVDERGIEPAPAPPARDLARRLHAAGRVEDLDGLGEAEDPREQRDLLPREPVRLPAPVPVLVERADRRRRLLAEVEHAARSPRRGRSGPP